MKPIIINLFGAPGSGKSTGAAYIFSKLKMKGINAELVTEYPKDKTWENNKIALNNQVYIFGKQYFRITRCINKVDVIVTDSPLLLSLIYNTDPVLGDNFNNLVKDIFNSFNSTNYFLLRNKPYNPAGRNQTEIESDELSKRIEILLLENNIDYKTYNGDENGYNDIYKDILERIEKDVL